MQSMSSAHREAELLCTAGLRAAPWASHHVFRSHEASNKATISVIRGTACVTLPGVGDQAGEEGPLPGQWGLRERCLPSPYTHTHTCSHSQVTHTLTQPHTLILAQSYSHVHTHTPIHTLIYPYSHIPHTQTHTLTPTY